MQQPRAILTITLTNIGGECDAMQLRDRTFKLHASWPMRPWWKPSCRMFRRWRRSFAKALDFCPYTTSFSCHDKCQWARRNPFFLSRQLQRAAARPRPRVSGFTWDITVLWQEIIACECAQPSTGHIGSCALRNVHLTFPRLPSRDRAVVVVIVGEVLKIWRASYPLTPPQGKTDGSFRNSFIHLLAPGKNSSRTNLSRKNSDGLFFSKIELT